MSNEKITVKVPVFPQTIDRSDIGVPTSCMVSNAVRETMDLTPAYEIDTSYTSTSIKAKTKSGKWKTVLRRKHTKEESEAIKQFDIDRSQVKPFEIEWQLDADWREKLLKAREEA